MHVHADGTGEGGLGGGVVIRASEPTVPEVGGGVFGGGEEEGDCVIGGGRDDGEGRGWVVFCRVAGEGFVEGGSVWY